jgi:Fe/S biogenesis protein NfuA
MIKITPAARDRFLEVLKAEGREGHGLRVSVQGGGTPRPEFALNFVDPAEAGEADHVEDLGPFKVYVDPDSAKFLEGASVDFIDNLTESGFKVEAPNAGIKGPEGPVAEAVQKALTDKINPSVQSHGGFVELVAIEDGTAFLRFGGGCQGCGMINVTLKQGVEKILFADVPEIKKVMDVTDHASGDNPYYQPAK